MRNIELFLGNLLKRLYYKFRNTEYFSRVVKDIKINKFRTPCYCGHNDWELVRFINCAGVLYSGIQCKHCKSQLANNVREKEDSLIKYWNGQE